MKKTTHIIIALLVMASTFLTSCNSDDEPQVKTFMTICTFMGSTDKGSTFTTQQDGDSPLVTFTTPNTFKESDLKTGERCMLIYTNSAGERFVSGPINLVSIYKVYGTAINLAGKSEIQNLDNASDYYISAVERSGNYINVIGNGKIDFEKGPKLFGLYFDEATVNNACPDAYVVFQGSTGVTKMMQFFGSYNIQSIWSQKSCQGIRVHYLTTDGMKYQQFDKSALPIVPDPVLP